jgi:hypothetical protein
MANYHDAIDGYMFQRINRRHKAELLAWFDYGTKPNRSMVLVLSNDLQATLAFWGWDDIPNLSAYTRFLALHAPLHSWGSWEAVNSWRGVLTPQDAAADKREQP